MFVLGDPQVSQTQIQLESIHKATRQVNSDLGKYISFAPKDGTLFFQT